MARSAPHSSSIGYQVQSFAWVGQPLTGRIRQSLTLVRAQPFAVRVLLFVRACAERTAAEDLPMREGVDFEPLLGLLIPGKETV